MILKGHLELEVGIANEMREYLKSALNGADNDNDNGSSGDGGRGVGGGVGGGGAGVGMFSLVRKSGYGSASTLNSYSESGGMGYVAGPRRSAAAFPLHPLMTPSTTTLSRNDSKGSLTGGAMMAMDLGVLPSQPQPPSSSWLCCCFGDETDKGGGDLPEVLEAGSRAYPDTQSFGSSEGASSILDYSNPPPMPVRPNAAVMRGKVVEREDDNSDFANDDIGLGKESRF